MFIGSLKVTWTTLFHCHSWFFCLCWVCQCHVSCPEAFLQSHPAAHPIFQPSKVPCSGLSIFRPDWMHTKLLGVDANLLGSAILFLAKEVMPASLEDNISIIWSGIQSYYKKNKTKYRLSRLTPNMVQNDPFPRLSAKAMEVRGLVPAVLDVLKGWEVRHTEITWFSQLLGLSCQMDEIVFGCKEFVLPPSSRAALCKAIFDYNKILTVLARNFHSRGLAYCNFTVKNHYLCHLALDASKSGISPRMGFCFQGEDMMRILRSLCQGSNRGVDPAKLVDKIAAKYLRGLDLMLSRA